MNPIKPDRVQPKQPIEQEEVKPVKEEESQSTSTMPGRKFKVVRESGSIGKFASEKMQGRGKENVEQMDPDKLQGLKSKFNKKKEDVK